MPLAIEWETRVSHQKENERWCDWHGFADNRWEQGADEGLEGQRLPCVYIVLGCRGDGVGEKSVNMLVLKLYF